jgi:hypothetical protein
MGAIIQWIVRGLAIGGPAAIGYFINDLGSWVANVTGTSAKVVDKSGRFAWWFILVIVAVAGAILFFVLRMLSGKKKGGLGL